MNGHRWQDLAPSALLALGIVAGQAAQAAWNDLAGTAVLALALLGADALAGRLGRAATRPSPPARVLAAAFVVAGALALLREPGHTASLIPLFGLGAWTSLFMPGGRLQESREASCSLS